MRFRVERDALHNATALMARIAGKYPPATGTSLEVEGDKLRVAATDLDLMATTNLSVAGGEEGRVVAPARQLADVVGAMRQGTVEVEAADTTLRLTVGRMECSVPLMATSEFLSLPEAPEGSPVEADALRSMLARVVPAASKDASRPVLCGVLFDPSPDGLHIVATDSYRLATGHVKCEWEGDAALVPAIALREMLRLSGSSILIGRQDTAMSFTVGETTLTTQLIERDAPNWRVLLERHQGTWWLQAKSADLIDALERLEVAVEVKGPARFEFTPESLLVSAVTMDGPAWHDEVMIEWDGPEMFMGFDPRYLRAAIAATGTEQVRIGIGAQQKEAAIRPDPDDGFLTILMRHYGIKE